MSSNASQVLRITQEFPNLIKDSPIEQKQVSQKQNINNSTSKQSKKKKKISDSTSSDISRGKMQDYDFLGGNSMLLNNQYNQNCMQGGFQNGKLMNGVFASNVIGGDNSFQNLLDLSNQYQNAMTPLKSQKIKQNNQYLNQSNNLYEKDILSSQNQLENQYEMNGLFANKLNNFQVNLNSSSSTNGQIQQQLQSNSKKKQNKQTKNQSDSSQKLSQSEGEQQQQQQFLYENESLVPNLQKKNLQLGQYTDENSIFNPNLNLEILQYDTKFSFNPIKMSNSNSYNHNQNNPINQSSSNMFNNENNLPECPFNQLQQEIVSQTYTLPPVIFTDEEPRYVNAAQFKRMMIMRIKRAARDLKQNKVVPQREIRQKEKPDQQQQMQSNPIKFKKYKYESRHKHATNRIRDSKGRFIPKDQLQDYLEQLEKEKQEKEAAEIKDQQKNDYTKTDNNDNNNNNNNNNNNTPVQQSTNKNIQRINDSEQKMQRINDSDQKYNSFEQYDETQQEDAHNQYNMEEEQERKDTFYQLNEENGQNFTSSSIYRLNNNTTNNNIQQQPTQNMLPESNAQINQTSTNHNNFTNLSKNI